MSKEAAPYTRLGRILALMDFSWGRTQRMLDRVGELDAWMNRFRPGGPHALWIAGHLAYVEAGSLARYTGAEHALASWKDLFGNGSETVDDAARYPAVAEVSAALRDVRARYREYVAGLADADLDRADIAVSRLPVQDLHSHVGFMIWHDGHHGAQLQGIVKTAEEADL